MSEVKKLGRPARFQEHGDHGEPAAVREPNGVLEFVVDPARLALPPGHRIGRSLREEKDVESVVLERGDELGDLEVTVGFHSQILDVEGTPGSLTGERAPQARKRPRASARRPTCMK